MLEIDYSLIPLGDKDRESVLQDVRRRIKAGVVPALDKSKGGRVVVVNPDPVQTTHHIPDELRTVIRRIMVQTTEGSTSLRAERIFADIIASDEPIVALVIELQSDFEHLSAFLDYIPELRRRYPDMGVFLSGTIPNAIEKLRQVLAAGKATLVLSYPDARGTVDIDDPNELNQAVSKEQDAVTFTVPFFSQLRIVMEKNAKPVPVNIDTLRRLHPVFGVGEAKEIDIGGGRKDRVVVVDLPLRIIRDIQFRQDRGLEFHGIVQNGRTILSRHFDREKLELKWIPLKSIEAFLRKMPSDPEVQRADLTKAKTLRINCFNGHLSFHSHVQSAQISLADTQMVAVRKHYTPQLRMPEGVAAPPQQANPVIAFDKVVLPGSSSGRLEPIQQAIRDHYFTRLLLAEATQARKTELYTRRLKVAGVGPLAGQTLKLLRRFGLERLIDAQNFHYLCDTPMQLPTYPLTPQRFVEHFAKLRSDLREIAGVDAGNKRIRMSDINHKLPISTEWVDAENVDFARVTPQELEGVYGEMNTVIGFISHEFQRNFDIAKEDVQFFQKIKLCRQAGLMAKWLAEYKQGSYGAPMPPGTHPDFVFFGTPEDKAANDKSYFFPSLACSELFKQPANQALFSKVDYEFSVFLEEQLALADHTAREAGVARPGFEHFAKYFDAKAAEAEETLNKLQEAMLGIDMEGSVEYQSLLKTEEENYYTRYRAIIQERDQVASQHQELERSFQDFILAFAKELNLPPDPDPAWTTGAEPDPAVFDHFFVQAGRRERQRRKGEIDREVAKAIAGLREWWEALKNLSDGLDRAMQTLLAWQQALLHEALTAHAQALAQQVPERQAAIQKLDAKALENQAKRVAAQFSSADGEFKRTHAQLLAVRKEEERMRRNLQGWLLKTGQRLKLLGERHAQLDPAQALALVAGQAKQTGELARAAETAAAGLTETVRQMEAAFTRRQRLAVSRHGLAVDNALMTAARENTAPVLPDPAAELMGPAPSQPPAALREAHQAALKSAATWLNAAKAAPQAPLAALEQIKAALQSFQRYCERLAEMERQSAKKTRLRATDRSLVERQALMETELEDLPRRVVELYMPARKMLLQEVFIPDAQRRLFYLRQAKGFLSELLNLPQDDLRELYQDRAVYRRFSSHQFMHGLQIAFDPNHPKGEQLRNVNPAISLYFRTLQYNLQKYHPGRETQLKLERMAPLEPAQVMELVQRLHAEGDSQAVTYLFLPSTLSVGEAIPMINQKDTLYKGVPRLVMVYLGKYGDDELLANPKLRAGYFQAVKHNVILNIDGRKLVDNPQAIAWRLLNETLGSSFDTPRVDEMPMEDERLVQRVRGA